MPRARSKSNAGLPKRWRVKHGAYYYRVPPGLEHLWEGKSDFRLGGTLAEAHACFAARIDLPSAPIVTLADLFDRYEREVLPHKSAKSRTSQLPILPRLRKVFGTLKIRDPFKPAWVYAYIDKRRVKIVDPETGKRTGGLTAAHREIELLSHAFTKAVEWGLIDKHPFLGQVRLDGDRATKPRTRYVEDWEVVELLRLEPRRRAGSVRMIQAYIRLKMLTGLARSDLLRLRLDEHIRDDGIHVTRHKTGTRPTVYTYELVPERRDAVELAKRSRPALSPFLFCTRAGQSYIDETTGEAPGWKSMWQRFMARVIAETKITEPFGEHDLRAKVGSDADSLEKARALLQHASTQTTQRVYRRKPERI